MRQHVRHGSAAARKEGLLSSHRSLQFFQSRGSAQSLGVTDMRQCTILRIQKRSLDLLIENPELLDQRSVTMLWQRFNQVLDHGTQATRDLHALRAAAADFREGEMDK